MKLQIAGKRIDMVFESTSIHSKSVQSSKSHRLDRLKFGIAEMCAMVSRIEAREIRNDILREVILES